MYKIWKSIQTVRFFQKKKKKKELCIYLWAVNLRILKVFSLSAIIWKKTLQSFSQFSWYPLGCGRYIEEEKLRRQVHQIWQHLEGQPRSVRHVRRLYTWWISLPPTTKSITRLVSGATTARVPLRSEPTFFSSHLCVVPSDIHVEELVLKSEKESKMETFSWISSFWYAMFMSLLLIMFNDAYTLL